jgi:hypothetical protein
MPARATLTLDSTCQNHCAAVLVALERRTARSGRDSIDHPPGGRDDVANAVAGALVMAEKACGDRQFYRKIEYPRLGIV